MRATRSRRRLSASSVVGAAAKIVTTGAPAAMVCPGRGMSASAGQPPSACDQGLVSRVSLSIIGCETGVGCEAKSTAFAQCEAGRGSGCSIAMPDGGAYPQAARWQPAIEPAPDRSKSSIDAVGRGLTSITVMLPPASTTRSTPTRPTGWNRSARTLPSRSSDAIKGSVSDRPPAACRVTAPHQANMPAWHHGSPINCRLTPNSRAERCLKQYDADRGVPIMNRCQIWVGRGVMACLVACSAATS